jgi:hypothetical protein
MTSDEIILQDAEMAGVNGQQLLQGIKKQLASGEATALRSGNSVLILQRIGEGQAELHLFTADNGVGVAKAVKDFIEKIRKSDIKTVYGKADNEQILKLLGMFGVNVTDSDLPEYNWRAEVWAQ